ncbi:hypothetical protein ACH5RR_036650 [Cinchona calisaya]|uniref:peroxidase n=1 Tax=Cinchona calisaya TaxID=153742 RepID=A0ABD2Y592_9GENT
MSQRKVRARVHGSLSDDGRFGLGKSKPGLVAVLVDVSVQEQMEMEMALFSREPTASIVNEYSNNPRTFASDFAYSMVKMGDIEPLTGQNGIIRRICSAVN